jgi:hypothetical protein
MTVPENFAGSGASPHGRFVTLAKTREKVSVPKVFFAKMS